jgi:(p)ppGpp synthase/HD superfamily hydrolase
MDIRIVCLLWLLDEIKRAARPAVKEILFKEFSASLKELPLTQEFRDQLDWAFSMSFDEHWETPNRASGEIYFMHIFRQVTRVSKLMVRYRVRSTYNVFLILATTLLHDTIEDAEKAKLIPFVVYSQILIAFGELVTYMVKSLTKNKERETRREYLLRVAAHEMWQVQFCKILDVADNIQTLAATPPHSQPGKILEVFESCSKIMNQMVRHIEFEMRTKRLPDGKAWKALVRHVYQLLRRHAHAQKRRLAKETS